MIWSDDQLHEEWRYVYCERLAILGCYGVPNVEQHEMAKKDADEAVEKLRKEE